MSLQRLNKKGQAILECFLNDIVKFNILTPLFNMHKEPLLQQVRAAGNTQFSELDLQAYFKKRNKMFQNTRASNKPRGRLAPAGPAATVKEEERYFGQIAGGTRMHLRWLYQVLDEEDHAHLEYWTCQPEYAVSLSEIKKYFKYLKRSGVSVFRGLTKEARFKLQGLLRGDPGADERKHKIWAKRVGVDDVEEVSAFVRHLQEFMGSDTKSNGGTKKSSSSVENDPSPVASPPTSIENPEPVRVSPSPPTSNVVSEPTSKSLPTSNALPETAPERSPSPKPGTVAEHVGGPEVIPISSEPQIKLQSKVIPTPLTNLRTRGRNSVTRVSPSPARKDENTDQHPGLHVVTLQDTSKDSPHEHVTLNVAGSKRKRSPTPDDSFILFDNHPLRSRGPGNRYHQIRIVPVKPRKAVVSVRWKAVPMILPETEAEIRDLIARTEVFANTGETIANTPPVEANPSPGLKVPTGIMTPSFQSIQAEHQVERPSTPPGIWNEVLTPPSAALVNEDMIAGTDTDNDGDNDDGDELMYPQNEAETTEPSDSEMEVDELDPSCYDEPQIVLNSSDNALISLPTSETRDEFSNTVEGVFARAGIDLRTVEELKRWIDKNELPIAELKRLKRDKEDLGLLE